MPSARYVALKHEDCAEVGITSHHVHLGSDASMDDVLAAVRRFNEDDAVDAFLVQVPLPDGFADERALFAVDPDKDADGLHPVNLGRLMLGTPVVLPCTPSGIVELLRAYRVPVEGRHVVVIGRGLTIGRPLSVLLTTQLPGCNAAVTVVHTGVSDLAVDRAHGRRRGRRGRACGPRDRVDGQARRSGRRRRHDVGG